MAGITDHLSAIRGPYWQKHARCAKPGMHDLFFPEKDNPSKEDYAPALQECRACPVREQCLQYALDTKTKDGVWGGLTPREREALTRMGSEVG